LKDKRENLNLEELFRYKLENSEVLPDESVRNELLHKLEVKEFIRFNPLRINIYYLGGFAAAALVSILILTTGPDSSRNTKGTQSLPSHSTDSISNIDTSKPISDKQPAVSRPKVLIEGNKSLTNKTETSVPVIQGTVKTVENKVDTAGAKTDTTHKVTVLYDNTIVLNSKVVLRKPIGAFFDVSLSGGCSPLKVKFFNNSISYDSCRWIFGDGGFSDEKNPEWIFDLEGEYKIVLNVFNSEGAQATASTTITVHPKPIARFEITPEKPVLPDDEIRFLNFSVNAVRYKWEFGDGLTSNDFEPDHKYRRYGSYNVRLIALSEYGCSDSMLVKNAFSQSGCFINFPNAFIPGSDGPAGGYYSSKSDEAARIFHPATSGVTEYHLKIFSKLGILIFESNDINIGWDGYLKGQLCEPGVYIWKVRGTFKNGEPFVKMGDITLLKN
jgi:PKD repeat protein